MNRAVSLRSRAFCTAPSRRGRPRWCRGRHPRPSARARRSRSRRRGAADVPRRREVFGPVYGRRTGVRGSRAHSPRIAMPWRRLTNAGWAGPAMSVSLSVARGPSEPSPGARTATAMMSLPISIPAHRSYRICIPPAPFPAQRRNQQRALRCRAPKHQLRDWYSRSQQQPGDTRRRKAPASFFCTATHSQDPTTSAPQTHSPILIHRRRAHQRPSRSFAG